MQDLLSLSNPLFLMVAVFAIFYFLVWRPQAQQQKKLRAAIDAIRRGDTIVLNSGIVGKVAKAPAKEDAEFAVEIADGVVVKVLRGAVGEVRAKNQPVETKTEK
jgi:preprotein translocase subunit YajC